MTLVYDLWGKVLAMLFAKKIKGVFGVSVFFQFFDSHFVVVQFIILGVLILEDLVK